MGLFSWLGGGSGGAALPPDRLRIEHLASGTATLQAATGLPAACDALAYEPTQRLLAVSRLQAAVDRHGLPWLAHAACPKPIFDQAHRHI
jgi:hypothetical protein